MKKHPIKSALYILCLFILGFMIYSNTFEVPFVFDDLASISNNPDIRMTDLEPEQIFKAAFGKDNSPTRPLAMITFALNYYFHQYDLPGYHLVNILIHIFTGVFLFLFIRFTLRIYADGTNNSGCEIWDMGYGRSQNKNEAEKGRPGKRFFTPASTAFLAALLWLVHPLHIQSVTYLVQRMNSMAAMFYLLALLLFIKGRVIMIEQAGVSDEKKNLKERFKSKSRLQYLWFSGCFLSWILALGSKQTAATLPFFIFLYEWFFFQGLSRTWIKRSLKYILIAFFILVIVGAILLGSHPIERLTSLKDYSNNEFTLGERLLTQPRVVIFYLSLIFLPLPSRLNLDRDFPLSHSLIDPVTTLFSLAIIAGLICLACYTAKKNRLLSFSIFWFLGNLLIESSIIPLALIFDHRTYLPSMLIFLPIVVTLYKRVDRKIVVTVPICLVVIMLSVWSYQRNQVWKDEVTLYRDCIKKSPEKARPYFQLGTALESMDRPYDAITQYLIAIKIKPDYYTARNNLAMIFSKQGRIDEAIEQLIETIRSKPSYYYAYNNLGNALSRKGLYMEALEYYMEAIKIKPDYLNAYDNLGLTLEKLGRTDEAIGYYSQSLKINQDYANGYYNLAVAFLSKDEIGQAVENLEKLLLIEPGHTLAQNLLNQILLKQKAGIPGSR